MVILEHNGHGGATVGTAKLGIDNFMGLWRWRKAEVHGGHSGDTKVTAKLVAIYYSLYPVF